MPVSSPDQIWQGDRILNFVLISSSSLNQFDITVGLAPIAWAIDKYLAVCSVISGCHLKKPFKPFTPCLIILVVVKTFNVVYMRILECQLAYTVNGQWETQNLKHFDGLGNVILLLWNRLIEVLSHIEIDLTQQKDLGLSMSTTMSLETYLL